MSYTTTATASPRPAVCERRGTASGFEPLLPEFFPVKLIGAFISIDFVVGCTFDCSFCISRRHPARAALFDEGVALGTRVPPRRVLAWLRSMPSYAAGVQLRIGHDTDAALAFDESAELVSLVDPDRSVVYLSRRPLRAEERAFFREPRRNLLLKLTATPRSAALGVHADPLQLVRSAGGLDHARLHWVVGPLVADSMPDALRVVDALPPGSRVTLKPLNTLGLPRLEAAEPMAPSALRALEARSLSRRLVVTEWFCRGGLAAVGRGFFDVDKMSSQSDPGRRALDLLTCAGCPSSTQCHSAVDRAAVEPRLRRALAGIGLTPAGDPEWRGARSIFVPVAEPASRGDETYLSHALGTPVSVTLSSREVGTSEGGAFCNVDPAVLRRWWARGFLPVAELNAAAQGVLDELRSRLGGRLPLALRPGAAGAAA